MVFFTISNLVIVTFITRWKHNFVEGVQFPFHCVQIGVKNKDWSRDTISSCLFCLVSKSKAPDVCNNDVGSYFVQPGKIAMHCLAQAMYCNLPNKIVEKSTIWFWYGWSTFPSSLPSDRNEISGPGNTSQLPCKASSSLPLHFLHSSLTFNL